jgi:hypothetical protein
MASTATKTDDTKSDSKTESYTVVVHTAVLQVRNPKTERITDRVLHGGDPPIDLDPSDEFVERLIGLNVLRPTKEVEAERKARQEFQEARDKYLASLGELERERIAAATGKPTQGVVEAGQPDAAAATPDDEVVDLGGPDAKVPVVAPVAL